MLENILENILSFTVSKTGKEKRNLENILSLQCTKMERGEESKEKINFYKIYLS